MSNEDFTFIPRDELIRLDGLIRKMIDLHDQLPQLAVASDERMANVREYAEIQNEVNAILPFVTKPLS